MALRRWKIVCCIVVAVIVGTSGCNALRGSDPESATGGGAELEKTLLNVAILNSVDLAPFWLAQDGGYFKAEGIDVRSSVAKTGDVSLSKVINGEADIALTTYPLLFIAQGKGAADLKIVADGTYASPKSNQLIVMPNSSVKSVNDLPGKKIGITSKNAASDILTRSMMADHGVDSSNVTWVPLGLPDMASALQRGAIDVAYQPEPFLTQAAMTIKASPILDVATGSTKDFPITGYTATAKWTQQNPKAMAAFQRAMRKATHDTNANRKLIEPLVVKYGKVPEDVTALMTLPSYRSTADALSLQRVPDKLLELGGGAIPGRVDAANMIVKQAT